MTLGIVFILLIGTIPGPQTPAPDADISSILARADAAYYDARFNDAIALLAPLDAALEARPERIDDRVRIKLQLALSHIGLNQIEEAKTRFSEIYEINPQFAVDPAKFAPKVIALFNDAKAAYASDAIFKEAVEEYRRGELRQSLSKIRMILKLSPNDVLATQYLKLIHERLEVSIKLAALQWRTQFDAHDFPQASETYRQLVSTDLENKAAVTIDEIRNEYRKTLTGMLQSWSQACKAKDRASLNRIGTEANGLLPDPSIGKDILDQMTNCVATPPPPAQTVANSSEPARTQDCIQNPPDVAMTRLKKRVEPQFPAQVQGKQVKVRAALRIDDSGNTTVRGLTGGSSLINRAVVKAVQDWKFYPAKVDSQPRCVETELSIVLTR
jgi:tetratricopeptide (TPR) repeat protein